MKVKISSQKTDVLKTTLITLHSLRCFYFTPHYLKFRPRFSLLPFDCLFSLQEILAASSDEDDGGDVVTEAVKDKGATVVQTATEPPRRRLGLAAELERATSVAGLSRRSRRNLLVGAHGESSDDSNEGFDDLGML